MKANKKQKIIASVTIALAMYTFVVIIFKLFDLVINQQGNLLYLVEVLLILCLMSFGIYKAIE